MNLFIGLLCAVTVLALSSYNWRWSIKSVLIIVVIEGGLRKWVLPQASELIYFLKDGVLMGAYAGYLLKEANPFSHIVQEAKILGWLIGALVIIGLQILNPASGSLLFGLLGAKSYLLYIPIAFLLPELFQSSDKLRQFVQWYLLLCIPVCLLGVAQFFAPPDSPINVYAPSLVETDAATFGEDGNVRVTGTFPYIVGFSMFLIFCLVLISAILVHQKSLWWLLMSGVELLLIGAGLFMSGARAAMLSAIIVITIFCCFSLFERNKRSRSLALVLAMSGFVCFVGSLKVFPSAVAAFVDRVQTNDDAGGRFSATFTEPCLAASIAGAGGYGTGSEQVACFALRDALQLGPPPQPAPFAEMEATRIMLELGVVGFIGWYGLRACFLWLLWRTSRRLRSPMLRHLALAGFVFHALLFTGQLVTNTSIGILYWFLAGFAFLLPRLDELPTSNGRLRLQRHLAVEMKSPVFAASI